MDVIFWHIEWTGKVLICSRLKEPTTGYRGCIIVDAHDNDDDDGLMAHPNACGCGSHITGTTLFFQCQ